MVHVQGCGIKEVLDGRNDCTDTAAYDIDICWWSCLVVVQEDPGTTVLAVTEVLMFERNCKLFECISIIFDQI